MDKAHQANQEKQAKIKKIAQLEQRMADEAASDVTPRPASKGNKPRTRRGKTSIKVPEMADEGDKMDVDDEVDNRADVGEGNKDVGSVTEGELEKPAKKKMKEGVRAVVGMTRKGVRTQDTGGWSEEDDQATDVTPKARPRPRPINKWNKRTLQRTLSYIEIPQVMDGGDEIDVDAEDVEDDRQMGDSGTDILNDSTAETDVEKPVKKKKKVARDGIRTAVEAARQNMIGLAANASGRSRSGGQVDGGLAPKNASKSKAVDGSKGKWQALCSKGEND